MDVCARLYLSMDSNHFECFRMQFNLFCFLFSLFLSLLFGKRQSISVEWEKANWIKVVYLEWLSCCWLLMKMPLLVLLLLFLLLSSIEVYLINKCAYVHGTHNIDMGKLSIDFIGFYNTTFVYGYPTIQNLNNINCKPKIKLN